MQPLDPAGSLRFFYGEMAETGEAGREKAAAAMTVPALRQSSMLVQPQRLDVPSIVETLQGQCNARLSQYHGPGGVVNIVLELESARERITLAQTLGKLFRPLLDGPQLACDGLYNRVSKKRRSKRSSSKRSSPAHEEQEEASDWIVLDLQAAVVHIFSPRARIVYDLDAHLGAPPPESDAEHIVTALCRMPSRRIARNPLHNGGGGDQLGGDDDAAAAASSAPDNPFASLTRAKS